MLGLVYVLVHYNFIVCAHIRCMAELIQKLKIMKLHAVQLRFISIYRTVYYLLLLVVQYTICSRMLRSLLFIAACCTVLIFVAACHTVWYFLLHCRNYNLQFVAALLHTVQFAICRRMPYSLLFVAACRTVCYLLLHAVQLAKCCCMQYSLLFAAACHAVCC